MSPLAMITILFGVGSFIKMALENNPIPKNKIGSFKIPDVQNNMLGNRSSIKNIRFDFNLE
jgi:hypothetical protein